MSGLLVMDGGPSWPKIPTRDQVCAVSIGFQGLTIHSQEFGAFPAFGPETSTLNDTDLLSYFAQVKAAGWTHVEFAVSWNYREPGYSYPVPGRDLSQNIPELKRRVVLAIKAGLLVALFCAGDGESVNDNPQPGQYNDPQGWTYGRQWLMRNFQRIYDGMGPSFESPEDCRPFMVFVPGYDGCWYGWKDAAAVVSWWLLCRATINRSGGYQGFEYAAGLCQLGDGFNTYGPGQTVDVFLQEFPVGPLPSSNPDQVWQILGRMLGPSYVRPADQPSWDDPDPPYYLEGGTPRGPWFYICYEYDTYTWVRGEVTEAGVQKDRAYLAGCGSPHVC